MRLLERLTSMAKDASTAPKLQEAVAVSHEPELLQTLRRMAADSGLSDVQSNPAFFDERRIIELPLVEEPTEEEVEDFNQRTLLRTALEEGLRLNKVQVGAILQFQREYGAFLAAGAGSGKTLAAQGISAMAYSGGISHIMLFVPKTLVYQLVHRDFPKARRFMPIPFDLYVLAGRDRPARTALAAARRPGLYIASYSTLQNRDGEEILRKIKPGLIICDECHHLKHPSTPRTQRLMRYVDEEGALGVTMSGSVSSRSLRDFWHLVVWCMRERACVPLDATELAMWRRAVDAKAMPTGNDMAAMSWLRLWAIRYDAEHASKYDAGIKGTREAFQFRLRTAPGVVATTDMAVPCSLTVDMLPVEGEGTEGWDRLQELIDGVVQRWETPNGDEIPHAAMTYKWLWELWGGFYNELYWQEPAELAAQRKISVEEATELIELAKIHHELGNTYKKSLRQWLDDNSCEGLDTPWLVGQSLQRHGEDVVGEALFEVWNDWKAADFEGRPKRLRRAVRVCRFKIDAAVEWAKREKTGVIWLHHKELALWLHEELVVSDLPSVFCPAGDKGAEAIYGSTGKIAVASMKSHGEGRNLQEMHHKALYYQIPQTADRAEQNLARLHRQGQPEDEVQTWFMVCSQWDQMALSSVINDACYLQQLLGNKQRLLYCDYRTMPELFPSEALIERGFEVNRLSREQQSELGKTFGKD